MDDITKGPAPTSDEPKAVSAPTDSLADQPVSDSDAQKVDETLTAPAEVKVDREGNLSGASTQGTSLTSAADSSKSDFKPPAFADDSKQSQEVGGNPMATPPAGKKKNNMMVIVIAIVIFVLLSVAAYLAYSNNNKKTTKTTSKTATVASTTQAAKTSDIDQANKDIDSQLNSTNDNKDFASTDLTDTSLGL